MKTLVVDDDPALRETLCEVLEAEGFAVSTAGDGEQALRQWEEVRPDLVLLDIRMPGLDGHEVCQRLRQWDPLRTTPIIMLTALSNEAEAVRGFEVGADDYVTKPFNIKLLVARMQTVLGRYRDLSGAHSAAN